MQEFAFNFGMLHDQDDAMSIRSPEHRNLKYSPRIAFLEGKNLHIGPEYFEFHEYAHVNVDRAIKAPLSQLVGLFHRENRFE